MPNHHSRRSTQAILKAVASPARLELLEALAQGPATTRELAARLGRSRQSLYYHLDLMIRAGLVEACATDQYNQEQRFSVRGDRLLLDGRGASSADRRGATRATRALLRAAEREANAALAAPATRLGGSLREFVGVRGKAHLSESGLRRANALIDELVALFRDSGGDEAQGPYSLTIVLTPARRRNATQGND